MKSQKINSIITVMSVMVLIIALFFAGCSSLPDKVESRLYSYAQLRMKAGREAQRRQDYELALRYYSEAYENYTRGDDIQGKVSAGISVARQYYYLDKPGEAEKWLNYTGELIENHIPRLKSLKTILQMEIAFDSQDFQKIIQLSKGVSEPDIEFQAELLCYSLVAAAHLNIDYKSQLSTLLSIVPFLEKRFKKNRMNDMEVLSFICYYIGYVYSYSTKDWKTALIYYEKAKTVDSAIDNTNGVGKDLFAIGICYEALGVDKEAESHFKRAIEVFGYLGDNKMVDKIKKHVKSID